MPFEKVGASDAALAIVIVGVALLLSWTIPAAIAILVLKVMGLV